MLLDWQAQPTLTFLDFCNKYWTVIFFYIIIRKRANISYKPFNTPALVAESVDALDLKSNWVNSSVPVQVRPRAPLKNSCRNTGVFLCAKHILFAYALAQVQPGATKKDTSCDVSFLYKFTKFQILFAKKSSPAGVMRYSPTSEVPVKSGTSSIKFWLIAA